MGMDIEAIKALVKSSDVATNATREEAGEMLFFGRVNQWDSFDGVQLEYRGQFDIIKPKRNKIFAELSSAPPSVQFKAKDGADLETAEMLMGKFRNDMIRGEEAVETMIQDQIDCGFGAFRFVTEYESTVDDTDERQRIKPVPINEANNVVYMDSGAKTKDKSDARWGLIISTFTDDSWKAYCKDAGIDYEANKTPQTFKSPKTSRNWLWKGDEDNIKIGEFYHRVKKRERILIFEDPLGNKQAHKEKEIKAHIEELEMAGFIKVGSKYIDKWEVSKYLVDGQQIIKTRYGTKQRIAGEYIPIVCCYGDWSYIEGRELWRGIYYDGQDGQRLHNSMMSYMADIVMKSPRVKPILPAGMIQGQEHFWSESGASDDYPYKLINEVSPVTGNPYSVGDVNYVQPTEIPQSLVGLMASIRQNIDDVTGTTIDPNQMLNGQVTEGQIQATQKSSNMESFLYRNSLSLAMKQAGRIYASQAKDIYDTAQEVTVTKLDGTEDQIQINEAQFNYETNEEEVLNDMSKGGFEAYVDTGPDYSTLREQAEAELREMATALQGTPEGQITLLSYLSLKDTPMFGDIRKWANNQLILQGIKEPETDEEIQMFEQAQQAAQQPQEDPNMVFAQAEMKKANVNEMDSQTKQMDSQTKQLDVQVKAFDAETKRLKAMSDIGKNDVAIRKTGAEITGNELDNVQRMANRFLPNQTIQ